MRATIIFRKASVPKRSPASLLRRLSDAGSTPQSSRDGYRTVTSPTMPNKSPSSSPWGSQSSTLTLASSQKNRVLLVNADNVHPMGASSHSMGSSHDQDNGPRSIPIAVLPTESTAQRCVVLSQAVVAPGRRDKHVQVDEPVVTSAPPSNAVDLPSNVASATPPAPPRFMRDDYEPLPTSHPVFGQQQVDVGAHRKRRARQLARGTLPLLSTVHPAFGTAPHPQPRELFSGPIGVSGFFLAVDPNVSVGYRCKMNPNAQLTIRDSIGNVSRVRFRGSLEGNDGFKLEALVRFQVGWISPRVTFSEVPHVIYLGRGFDISVPFLFHFTMVSILDEHGCATGSALYFSGTPLMGFSMGWSKIRGGKLVLDPVREPDPEHETQHHFFGHVHYRQLGFVVFKFLSWLLVTLICIPPVRAAVTAVFPDPLMRFSEVRAMAPQPTTVASIR